MSKRKKKMTKRANKQSKHVSPELRRLPTEVILTRRRAVQTREIASTLDVSPYADLTSFPEHPCVASMEEQTRVAIEVLDNLLVQVTPKLSSNDFHDGANVLVDAMMIMLARRDLDPVYTMIDAIADKSVDPVVVLDDVVSALRIHHGVLLDHGYSEEALEDYENGDEA